MRALWLSTPPPVRRSSGGPRRDAAAQREAGSPDLPEQWRRHSGRPWPRRVSRLPLACRPAVRISGSLAQDVDRAADGVAAVLHRRRAADDLDALDRSRVDPAEVLRRARAVGRRVEADAIEQVDDSLRTEAADERPMPAPSSSAGRARRSPRAVPAAASAPAAIRVLRASRCRPLRGRRRSAPARPGPA